MRQRNSFFVCPECGAEYLIVTEDNRYNINPTCEHKIKNREELLRRLPKLSSFRESMIKKA